MTLEEKKSRATDTLAWMRQLIYEGRLLVLQQKPDADLSSFEMGLLELVEIEALIANATEEDYEDWTEESEAEIRKEFLEDLLAYQNHLIMS